MTTVVYQREWKEYRRRQVVFFVSWLAVGLGMLAPVWLHNYQFPGLSLIFWFTLICFLTFLCLAHYRWRTWPCPRCGKSYFSPGWYWWNFSRKTCVHCGLERSPTSLDS